MMNRAKRTGVGSGAVVAMRGDLRNWGGMNRMEAIDGRWHREEGSELGSVMDEATHQPADCVLPTHHTIEMR